MNLIDKFISEKEIEILKNFRFLISEYIIRVDRDKFSHENSRIL